MNESNPQGSGNYIVLDVDTGSCDGYYAYDFAVEVAAAWRDKLGRDGIVIVERISKHQGIGREALLIERHREHLRELAASRR